MGISVERFKELMAEKEIEAKTLAQALGVESGTVYKWLRGKDMHLPNLLKLADYFECSLDYLAGRSSDYQNFQGKSYPPFSIRLREVLGELRVSQYRIVKDTHLSRSQFHSWYHGAAPTASNLVTLANYLDCTLDYLVGRE